MKEQNVFLRRSRILPKKLADYPFFLFLSIMIPITYWFEVWVVLPSIFSIYSPTHTILFLLAHFILHNVVGNFLGILFCDTSIRGRFMTLESTTGVKFCSVCETLAPPRSYHCPVCNICILKRDHHCAFTGCCIGHYNHRFFIMFIFYMLIATLICLPFNVYFLWDALPSSWSIIPRIIFPITWLLFEYNGKLDFSHVYVIISVFSIGGLIFCTTWFIFHIQLIFEGKVLHERRHCINIYNLGKENNIKMVFGERWHLTWISPFLSSALPCGGVTFPINGLVEQKDVKTIKGE